MLNTLSRPVERASDDFEPSHSENTTVIERTEGVDLLKSSFISVYTKEWNDLGKKESVNDISRSSVIGVYFIIVSKNNKKGKKDNINIKADWPEYAAMADSVTLWEKKIQNLTIFMIKFFIFSHILTPVPLQNWNISLSENA